MLAERCAASVPGPRALAVMALASPAIDLLAVAGGAIVSHLENSFRPNPAKSGQGPNLIFL